MELLSPAGNLEHVKIAIKNKSDAVYGGLKKWNARHKAMNFSVEEYNKVVRELHVHDIKFFLTLNTLMLDEELEEVLTFLKDPTTELPDAFIATDIGLIKTLKNYFPEIEIHLSTQFGVHNIDDTKLARSLGASRVILAREMTATEIKRVRNNTNLDVECFAWGSQCISYSGLCFFGSLINGGSGNRGKCIITCRDVYTANDQNGHLLYVSDLDCINRLTKMNDIDCIKLEGRRRPTNELESVIKQIKSNQKSITNNGFINGKNIKENKLFENINSRIKPICLKSDLLNISEYDVFMKFKGNIPIQFTNADDQDPHVYYVYSESLNEFSMDKKNLSFEIKTHLNHIKEILYVNYKGEGKTFYDDMKSDEIIHFDVQKFIDKMESINENINVYKLTYKNIEKPIIMSKSMMKNIVDYIKLDCQKKQNHYIKNEQFQRLKELYIETNDLEVVECFLNDKFVKIIYNIGSKRNLLNIADVINKYDDKIIYKLPIFNWESTELISYYKLLEDKPVMFTKLSQIYKTKELRFKKKYVDYTIYIWNHLALEILKKYDIDVYTVSPELSYEKNMKLFNHSENIQLIVAGKLPLIYTRQCFNHLYNCSNCVPNNDLKNMKNIDKKMNFNIICEDDHRFMIHDKPILNNYIRFGNRDNASFRYVTYGQKLEEIKKSVILFQQDNYYNHLKKDLLWKESYECNIMEGRE